MVTVEQITVMHKLAEEWRRGGETIALVPTMGFLHEGHLELLRVGRKKANRLVMSLFVNPTQFGPSEDYEDYPRDSKGDLEKARSEGVDAVFMPAVKEMYPEGFQSAITVGEITQYLCGKSRPGHFDGVTTVVAKLFNAAKPHFGIFGQKDYQQLAVIKRMVRDLNMDIEILGVPTVREPDGLAMSSRNSYLSEEQRPSALSLRKSLDLVATMVAGGENDAAEIKKTVGEFILGHPFTEIDYVTICDPERLTDLTTIEGPSLLALAVKVGNTRLIDNVILRE